MKILGSSFLESLPQLLAQTFDSSAASAKYALLNHHHDYCVLSVQLPFQEVIIKLAGPASPMDATFERTAFIHSLLKSQTNVPVAEIVAFDVSYAHFPWRYLIQTRIPGVAWADIAPQLEPGQL